MLNYVPLTQQQYVDLLLNFISSQEGHAATRYQNPRDHTTIGYGYTFFRNNNLALWQAAGITLTSAEVALLQSIDAAPDSQKDSLALQFTRSISKPEAVELLRQTYPEYEGPANTLVMPFSEERIAFVSLTYNRGVLAVNTKMQAFFTAIGNQDRAEAWYQIRYNSNGKRNDPDPTQGANGIANRRYAESNLFDLYENTMTTEAEAKSIFRMYTVHRSTISGYESSFPPATATSRTFRDESFVARNLLLSTFALFADAPVVSGEVLVGSNIGNRDNVPGNDLLLGEARYNNLRGQGGDDIIYGNIVGDDLYGDAGNDVLEGGEGRRKYRRGRFGWELGSNKREIEEIDDVCYGKV